MQNITNDINFVKNTTIDNIANTTINHSNIHGFGLFASKSIEPHSLLCILDGQLISTHKYEKIKNIIYNDITPYQKYFFMETTLIDKNTYLARPYRTKYGYINHSRDPNVKLEFNKTIIKLISIKYIEKNSEILIDYRKEKLTNEYKKSNDFFL